MLRGKADDIGWAIVSILLVVDGIHHAVTRQIWSRVRLPESMPVSEGWHVAALGIIEAMVGLYIAWRIYKRIIGK